MGMRPVVEMMFIEFIGVALDQLTTQGAFLDICPEALIKYR